MLIKYNLFDLTHIKVYTLKGEFLCTAERVTETHPMAKITTDMQNKKPVNQSEFYTPTNLLKYLPDLVKIEPKEQTQTPKPTGQLSEDFIKQIEKEFLGLE